MDLGRVLLSQLHAKDITSLFCMHYGLNNESANRCKAALLQWNVSKTESSHPADVTQQLKRKCELCSSQSGTRNTHIKVEYPEENMSIKKENIEVDSTTNETRQVNSLQLIIKTEKVEYPDEKFVIKEEHIKVDSLMEEKLLDITLQSTLNTEQAQAEHSAGSSTDAATARATGLLEEGEEWLVDASNWRAAVLALAERRPKQLTLRSGRDGVPETLKADTVATIVGAARDCEVWMYFVDSFYSPNDQNTDRQQLEHVLANKSLPLAMFYGHLDAAGIARLPGTIRRLGLAITSARNAAAVSSMVVWGELSVLDVAVSTSVAPRHLRPLPCVSLLSVHLYGISDSQVDLIRPVVDALMPYEELDDLSLPNCQLSAGGARRLAHQLRGFRIFNVSIEPRGLWRPGEEERRSITKVFRTVVRCHVEWDIEWRLGGEWRP